MSLVKHAALVGFVLIACVVKAPVTYAAEKMPPAIIAVIDSQRILRESAAFKQVRKQLEEVRSKYQSESSREDDRLRKEQEEIENQRKSGILPPDKYEARRREFENKVIEVQRKFRDRGQQLERSFGGARNELGKAVHKIVTDIAAERSFNVVLDLAQMTYSAPELDITTEVLRRLDQNLPKISLTIPPG
jgi:Skp family chaperone for outer membrane proteins